MRRDAVAQVLVDDLDRPDPSDEDLLHLTRSLRIRNGESVAVIDGTGAWRICSWGDSGLVPATPVAIEVEPEPLISVGFALLKSDKNDLVVQKLTEIGVDRMIPVAAERSTAKWDDIKSQRNVNRMRRIAQEATMQCRRVRVPEITDVTTLVDLAERQALAIAEPGGVDLSLAHSTLVIGPEGGWSDEELECMSVHVHLGQNVLRAETAAISAATLLCGLRDGLIAKPSDPTA